MEDHGRSVLSIAALVEGCFEGRFDTMGPPGEVRSEDGAWRVYSALLLLDQGFPEHLIHRVLWCSEKDARAMVDAIRLHLPDAHAVHAFLGKRDEKVSGPGKASEDSGLSLDSEDVKQALNMLEYWTDHWLQEYQERT